MIIISSIIRAYFAKFAACEKKSLRSMTGAELAVYSTIRDLVKALDSLACELKIFAALLNAFSSVIDRNLDIDSKSVDNLLVYARKLKNAFCVIQPSKEELNAITEFISNSGKRIRYFVDTIIPEVINDSALEEYMRQSDVTSILADMIDFYGSRSAVDDAAANGYRDYIESITSALIAPTIDSFTSTYPTKYVCEYPGDLPEFLTPAINVGSFFRGNSVCYA